MSTSDTEVGRNSLGIVKSFITTWSRGSWMASQNNP